jgi:biopolymer transport protein ExbD
MFPNSLAVSRVMLLAIVSMSACRGPAHNDSRSPAAHSPPVVDVVRTNTVVPVQRSSADAGSAANIVTVSLGVDANGRARTWVDNDPPEVLPAKIDISSFATVASKAKERTATQVVIAVDERTTYSQVVALIDALQKVGLTHIAIQLVPLTERDNTR